MKPKEYKVGAEDSIGNAVKSILGKSDIAVVYTTVNNQLRWEYDDGGTLPSEIEPAVSDFNKLYAEIKTSLMTPNQKETAYELLGKCLFQALNARNPAKSSVHYILVEEFLSKNQTPESTRIEQSSASQVSPSGSEIVAEVSKPKPELVLLLSGGGYRAAAFHLGVLRWLYEHKDPESGNRNQLESVTRVVGVSGGSFTAAHFYCNTVKYCNSFEDAAKGLLHFLANVDMRRELLKEERTAEQILKDLLNEDFIVRNNPRKVELEIIGTCVNSGECIVFNGEGIAAYAAGLEGDKLYRKDHASSVNVKCALAAAASSAFPPFLPPIVLKADRFPGVSSNTELKSLRDREVMDGGVRDNSGIEYALSQEWSDSERGLVIASDAGLPFDWDPGSYSNQSFGDWFRRLLRVVDIQMNRLAAIDRSRADAFKHVTIYATNDAHPNVDSRKQIFDRPLSKAIAGMAAAEQTDLVKIERPALFALVRLGYDCADRSSLREFEWNRCERDDKFWEELAKKEGEDSHFSEADLRTVLQGQSKKRVQGLLDLRSHVPKDDQRAVINWGGKIGGGLLVVGILLFGLGIAVGWRLFHH